MIILRTQRPAHSQRWTLIRFAPKQSSSCKSRAALRRLHSRPPKMMINQLRPRVIRPSMMTPSRQEQPLKCNRDLTKQRSFQRRRSRCKCRNRGAFSRRSSSEVEAVREVVVEAIENSLTYNQLTQLTIY